MFLLLMITKKIRALYFEEENICFVFILLMRIWKLTWISFAPCAAMHELHKAAPLYSSKREDCPGSYNGVPVSVEILKAVAIWIWLYSCMSPPIKLSLDDLCKCCLCPQYHSFKNIRQLYWSFMELFSVYLRYEFWKVVKDPKYKLKSTNS